MSITPLRISVRRVLAMVVLYLVLIQPNHPEAMTFGALKMFPLEFPVILLALLALGRGVFGTVLRVGLVAVLTLIFVLKLADYGMFTALGRGFNPVADLFLIDASVRLLSGAIGPIAVFGAIILSGAVVVSVAAALWWATGVWATVPRTRVTAVVSGGLAAVAGTVAMAEIGDTMGRWEVPIAPPGAAFTARVGLERVTTALETFETLREFNRLAATDDYAGRGDGLFELIDRDVLVVFVESYGRASLDVPYHAEMHRETLEDSAARLDGLGLAMRSGFLEAPTRGGQSWLSHASLANGLWVDDQARYGAALASGRKTLFHHAARAGFRTAAVMPQITMDWPESESMGFDTVLAAQDLGYAGLPFNWVTMPDQFTFSALDRLLRQADDARPLFAQIALGSSHAPWTPVPDLVAWDDIGDGRIFNDMATSGDTPEVVWRDRDRVRMQYRSAIDYALRTVFDYAARHASDPPLLIVVGDHQAAGFVALDDRPDVPIHVIGPPALVERVQNWGWSEGLVPAPDTPVIPMDRMRDMLLEAFSAPVEGRIPS